MVMERVLAAWKSSGTPWGTHCILAGRSVASATLIINNESAGTLGWEPEEKREKWALTDTFPSGVKWVSFSGLQLCQLQRRLIVLISSFEMAHPTAFSPQ